MNIKPQVLAIALVATFLSACSQAPNAGEMTKKNAAVMDMPAAEHEKMVEQMPPEASDATPSAKIASATGTVESIDATAGKITLAHGPVEALRWPAMTMAFKATPDQIASIKVGQKVKFEFQPQGTDATITRITPER